MLGRIDLLPLASRPLSSREAAIAEATGKQPRRLWKIVDLDDLLIKTALEAPIGGEATSAARNAMEECELYRTWQGSMPPLRDVQALHAYRNAINTDDLASNILVDACNEIRLNGDTLDAGQVLFRGGSYDDEMQLLPDRPTSTSMIPAVALRFAIDRRASLGVLRVRDPDTIKAFCFKTSGNQKHKGEMEVLLEDGLSIEKSRTMKVFVAGEHEVDVLFADLVK